MTLRNLTDEEMIAETAAWLDKSRLRPVFEAYLLLAAMLPSVQEAHDALVAGDAPKEDAALAKVRAKLYNEGVTLDRRHDRKGRGVFNLLGALADLSDDEAEVEGLMATRAKLFPDGNLKVLSASWKGEAGNALRIHDKVLSEKDACAELKAIPLTGKRTLLDGAREFVDAGRRLGTIDDRRVALGAPPEGTTAEVTPVPVVARNRWVAVVESAVNLVDKVLVLGPSERYALLGALTDSEKKADARALNRCAAEAAAIDTPEPAAPTTGDTTGGAGGHG